MSEKYYTSIAFPEGTSYVYMDISKQFDEMLRVTTETPQGDGKTTEPYYLEPAEFWDKVSDRYVASL